MARVQLALYRGPGTTAAHRLAHALTVVSSGALLGATMTMGQLFTGVASLIREKELAAEAAANPAPAAE